MHVLFRVPLPYQYSQLSQFDNGDPDDELADLEDNLHLLVEDSSSEDDEDDKNREIVARRISSERLKVNNVKRSNVIEELEEEESDEIGDDDVFLKEDHNAVSLVKTLNKHFVQ